MPRMLTLYFASPPLILRHFLFFFRRQSLHDAFAMPRFRRLLSFSPAMLRRRRLIFADIAAHFADAAMPPPAMLMLARCFRCALPILFSLIFHFALRYA